ncbi:MAG: hypothetical protein ABIA04_00280 [Pseudomonadota bacterium]
MLKSKLFILFVLLQIIILSSFSLSAQSADNSIPADMESRIDDMAYEFADRLREILEGDIDVLVPSEEVALDAHEVMMRGTFGQLDLYPEDDSRYAEHYEDNEVRGHPDNEVYGRHEYLSDAGDYSMAEAINEGRINPERLEFSSHEVLREFLTEFGLNESVSLSLRRQIRAIFTEMASRPGRWGGRVTTIAVDENVMLDRVLELIIADLEEHHELSEIDIDTIVIVAEEQMKAALINVYKDPNPKRALIAKLKDVLSKEDVTWDSERGLEISLQSKVRVVGILSFLVYDEIVKFDPVVLSEIIEPLMLLTMYFDTEIQFEALKLFRIIIRVHGNKLVISPDLAMYITLTLGEAMKSSNEAVKFLAASTDARFEWDFKAERERRKVEGITLRGLKSNDPDVRRGAKSGLLLASSAPRTLIKELQIIIARGGHGKDEAANILRSKNVITAAEEATIIGSGRRSAEAFDLLLINKGTKGSASSFDLSAATAVATRLESADLVEGEVRAGTDAKSLEDPAKARADARVKPRIDAVKKK